MYKVDMLGVDKWVIDMRGWWYGGCW